MKNSIIILLSAICLLTGQVGAQSKSPGPTTPEAHSHEDTVQIPITDITYKIQAGDELELNVFSLPAVDKKYVVRVDGGFYHPVIGEVKASGLTLKQLHAVLFKRLSRELKNPTFQLGLTSYAKREVSVLGEVRTQGKFSILPGATVLDVLALAGGLGDKADPESATLVRAGKNINIDLHPPSGSEQSALLAQPGDILYVHAGNRISVAGEVQKPGVYAVSRNSRDAVVAALKEAGGAKSTGAIHRVKLIRPTLSEPIILDGAPEVAANTTAPDQVLLDGDTLVVPVRQAILLGTVAKQGPVPLEGGEGLIDVVSQGGLSTDSDLAHVMVVRSRDVKSGDGKREVYNIRDYFKQKLDKNGKPVPSPKIDIQDGDVVYVGSSKKDNITSNIMNFSTLLLMVREFIP
jgi:polysaccharide export outer membrane protein